MTVYHDEIFPLVLTDDFNRSIMRKTAVARGGRDVPRTKRNQVWLDGLRRYDVSGSLRAGDDWVTLLAFYERMRASLHVFSVCDPHDNITGGFRTDPVVDSPLVVVDAGTNRWQLYKRYTTDYSRKISFPVDGTLLIEDGGALTEGPDFTVDYATGEVTFTNPPTAPEAGFQFRTPVRFESDDLDTDLVNGEAVEAAQVILIEEKL